jgi:ADP-heptose:LPS heptosyltransferase
MFDFSNIYKFPFKFEIPNYTQEFLENNSITKSWIKYLKRYLYVLIKGQSSLEIFQIADNHKKILWINFSAPSLGDSLMDLSSRVLLFEKNIDLLTDKKNAHIYYNDAIFSSVFTNKTELTNKSYDLVIVDSYSTKSIKIKTNVAPLVPFVGMYGYFNGPEVNRVLFSFHQINHLIGYSHSESYINTMAKNLITISSHDETIINSLELPNFFITIVIGGEWEYRTYNKWDKVIEELLLIDNNLEIVLLGSNNAKDIEQQILEKFSSSNLSSYVSKFSFNQTAQIISKSDFLFCCDGGLMHAANALNVKIIPLFARLEENLQLTEACKAFPLFDLFDVNNILVTDVILKYNEAANADNNHLLS